MRCTAVQHDSCSIGGSVHSILQGFVPDTVNSCNRSSRSDGELRETVGIGEGKSVTIQRGSIDVSFSVVFDVFDINCGVLTKCSNKRVRQSQRNLSGFSYVKNCVLFDHYCVCVSCISSSAGQLDFICRGCSGCNNLILGSDVQSVGFIAFIVSCRSYIKEGLDIENDITTRKIFSLCFQVCSFGIRHSITYSTSSTTQGGSIDRLSRGFNSGFLVRSEAGG